MKSLVIFMVAVWLPIYWQYHRAHCGKDKACDGKTALQVQTPVQQVKPLKRRLDESALHRIIHLWNVDMARRNIVVKAVTHTVRQKRIVPKRKFVTSMDKHELQTYGARRYAKINRLEMEHLKRLSEKLGIDGFMDYLDSTMGYEENKRNLEQQFGTAHTDNEYVEMYDKYNSMEQS